MQNIARQAVFRDTQVHHAARYRRRFEDGYWITQKRQVVRSGHSCGTRANNRHPLGSFLNFSAGKNVCWIPRFRSVPLGNKAFQCANRNGHVELAASARWFTRVSAHTAADGGKRVGGPGVAVGFFIPALCNQRDVAPSLCVHRARLHAREVRLQPLQINQFCTSCQSVSPRTPICRCSIS